MNRFQFNKINKIILIISLILLLIGYILMSNGNEILSTIILVIAYSVGIPLSIIYKSNK